MGLPWLLLFDGAAVTRDDPGRLPIAMGCSWVENTALEVVRGLTFGMPQGERLLQESPSQVPILPGEQPLKPLSLLTHLRLHWQK